MDERAYLHDNERLLVFLMPSKALLLWSWLRALGDTVFCWMLLAAGVTAGWWLVEEEFPPLVLPVGFFLILFVLFAWLKWRLWRDASLRVTSERILLQYSEKVFSHARPLLTMPGRKEPSTFRLGTYFSRPLKTIKWTQYQECYTSHTHVLDFLFGTRTLCVRYGTPQGELINCYPFLPYAQDLKHYLDKVDSAVRANHVGQLKAFVARPKGQRGLELGEGGEL